MYIPIKDRTEDVAMQNKIRFRANYSLAIMGMGAVYRASGRFLNIRSPNDPLPRKVKTPTTLDDKF